MLIRDPVLRAVESDSGRSDMDNRQSDMTEGYDVFQFWSSSKNHFTDIIVLAWGNIGVIKYIVKLHKTIIYIIIDCTTCIT